MKSMKAFAVAALATVALSGCCCGYKGKCYPYPLYDYSPAKVCGTCAPACAPAPVCAPACAPARPACAPCGR